MYRSAFSLKSALAIAIHAMPCRFDSCVEGGESILLDAFPVVEELRAKHPEPFDVLTRVPATIQRIHYDR